MLVCGINVDIHGVKAVTLTSTMCLENKTMHALEFSCSSTEGESVLRLAAGQTGHMPLTQWRGGDLIRFRRAHTRLDDSAQSKVWCEPAVVLS